jgi:hypothetical protein
MNETSINILEEHINTNSQLEYFKYSRNIKSYKSEEEIIRDKDFLFDQHLSIDEKKRTLRELASLNNVEAYRTIEKYLNYPNIKLYDWACIALQKSRLQIESKLLDESKVLISTGLGGKGHKLRYFIVLFTPNGIPLNKNQQGIIKKELEFFLKQKDAELEDIEIEGSFASILAMIPIKIPPQPLFRKVIEECNIFGTFLFPDFIITNVKALSSKEITELLSVNNIY